MPSFVQFKCSPYTTSFIIGMLISWNLSAPFITPLLIIHSEVPFIFLISIYLLVNIQVAYRCLSFLDFYYIISCYLWDKSLVMSCSGITWFESRVDPPNRWVISLFRNHWLRFFPAPSTYWICSWVCLTPQTKPNFFIVQMKTTSFTLQTLVIWPRYFVLHR